MRKVLFAALVALALSASFASAGPTTHQTSWIWLYCWFNEPYGDMECMLIDS